MKLEELRRNWDAFGRECPFYSILTNREDWREDEFFATGSVVVEQLMRKLEADGLALRRARALDFGCGAGRLSRALGGYYDEVVGIDIAASMVELATQLNRDHTRCRFVLNERDDLRAFDDASFDLVLTLLVLQHMRPDYAIGYIREFARILRPGGVLLMQIPCGRQKDTRAGRRVVRALERLIPDSLLVRPRNRRRAMRSARTGAHMETYAIPEREVVGLLEQLGMQIVRAETDEMGRYFSVTYTARRLE
jgi:SAM-dependent methyltransferase